MGRRKALDQKTLLSLEFQEYYAMIRKPYFVVGSVLLTLAWIASGAVMITLENEIATGIVSIVLGLGSFVVFMIGLKNRFLLYFDIIASASICLHYVIHLFDMFIHLLGNTSAHAFGHYVIPMTIFFAIFFSLRPQFALLCICACALLPALTTVSTTYPSQYDVHMVINNFILFGQYAFITVFALTYQQKLDIGRYVNQLKIHKTQRVLAEQREKSKDLLENLFPPVIREFVEQHRAENYPKATVVFADLENFAQLTAQLSPNESIDLLNQVFSYLDSLVTKYGLLKVKTTGEVYIAVANVPKESPTAAIDAIRFALDGVEGIRLLGATASMPIRPRFGVNTGFVVAGTMHTSKLTFDIYGDAVNLAHRMMHHGVPGAVQISINTLRALPAVLQRQILPDEPTDTQLLSARTAVTDVSRTPLGSVTPTSERRSAGTLSLPPSPNSVDRGSDNEVCDALCQDWILHPRGSIGLKNHGEMQAFLVSRPEYRVGDNGEVQMAGQHYPSPPEDSTGLESHSTLLMGDHEAIPTLVEDREHDTEDTCSQVTSSFHGGMLPSMSTSVRSSHTTLTTKGAASRRSNSYRAPAPRRQAAPSVASRSSAGSSNGNTTEIEEALDAFYDRAETHGDIFDTLRQAARQRVAMGGGEGEKGGVRRRRTQRGAPISPSLLALEILHFLRTEFRCIWMFKDRSLHSIFFRGNVAFNMKGTRYYMMFLLTLFLISTGFEAALLPHALPAVLIPRLGAFVPVTLACILLTFIKRTVDGKPTLGVNPYVHSVMHMVWLATYLCVLLCEMLLVLMLYPITDAIQKSVFEVHFLGEFAFFWLVGFCPWIPMHSHWYKQLVNSVLVVAAWPLLASFGMLPSTRHMIEAITIWILIFIASVFYELNGRQAFLQMSGMQRNLASVKEENNRFETLLESTLPLAVLNRLKSNPGAISQRIPQATVFFADFISFTAFCSNVPSVFVVQLLDEIYARFDGLCKASAVMPIMTIGDCYFAGAGLVDEDDHQVPHALKAAQEMVQELRRFNTEKGIELDVRVGLSTGVVFAGVLGVTRFTYDVWGPAVTEAKKMEAASARNRILMSRAAKAHLPKSVRCRDGPLVHQSPTFFLSTTAKIPE